MLLTPVIADLGFHVPNLIAQVVVFFLVYVVLSRYAFGPITDILEHRKKRIADGEAKLEKIARDLAAAEENSKAIIDKANTDAARLIKEANDAAASVGEKRTQDAVREAGNIIAKAHEAAKLEQEQLLSELKREFGRMVVDATSRVTGKVLTNEDQDRISKETAAQVSI